MQGHVFVEKNKVPAAGAQSMGGGSTHAIVTSYNYTDTLQVYMHPTSIQTPYKYTDILQVHSIQNTSPPKYKSRHSKYKSRHPNTNPDTKIQIQTPKIQIHTPKYTSSDTQNAHYQRNQLEKKHLGSIGTGLHIISMRDLLA